MHAAGQSLAAWAFDMRGGMAFVFPAEPYFRLPAGPDMVHFSLQWITMTFLPLLPLLARGAAWLDFSALEEAHGPSPWPCSPWLPPSLGRDPSAPSRRFRA